MKTGEKLGKYEIIRQLGAGGEGSVYLARDSVLSRLAAIKRLEGEWALSLKEADFLRDLHHPMLPVIYDLLYEDGWYLVMEYIEGISYIII